MLYYTEVCFSPYEVPEHESICIYISGCLNKCTDCHYPLLQQTDYGDTLYDKFKINEVNDIYAAVGCIIKQSQEWEYTFRNLCKLYELY